jgi:aldehyde:ferredoxin oxidoreductase
MTMPYGYCGKILKLNLTTCDVQIEEPDDVFYRTYGGGSCLAVYYLLKEMKPGLDAFDPGNVLVFAPGVTTGAPCSGLSRFNVTAKSPLTGAVGDSQGGGFWGAELKLAGFDAVVVTGRAESPVYLWICDGQAEIRDATALWGMDTALAQAAIREEVGEPRARVALIGIGGENLVRYACIANELHHLNGRTGMGAVMGSKNLKAIAVRGHGEVELAHPDALRAIAKSVPGRIRGSATATLLQDLGTAGFVRYQNADGGLPTRNFASGFFEGGEEIDGAPIHERYYVRSTSCYACAVRCKQVIAAEVPYPIDPAYGGPEMEGLSALGAYTGVSDLAAVCKANELCNRYTLDTISTGATIAWAMDCFERGIIGQAETGGLTVRFGDGATLVRLVEMIARRQGVGDLLAEGPARAAQAWGEEAARLAIHTKGQPFPAHMPRVKRSLALAYATNPFGADHISTEQDPFLLDAFPADLREKIKALGIQETADLAEMGPIKVRLVAYSQRFFSILDTLELCSFCFAPAWFFDYEDLVAIVRAVTGWKTNFWELMKLGERRINLMRAFNAREGWTAEHDVLPPRMAEPLVDGPTAGGVVDMDAWREDRKLYYQMMGWDPDTGHPTAAKLYELELGWVVEELRKQGLAI